VRTADGRGRIEMKDDATLKLDGGGGGAN